MRLIGLTDTLGMKAPWIAYPLLATCRGCAIVRAVCHPQQVKARFWVPNQQMPQASHYLRSVFVCAVAQKRWKDVWPLLSVLYDLESDSEPPTAYNKARSELGDDARANVRVLETWAEQRATPHPGERLALVTPDAKRLHRWLRDRARQYGELEGIFTDDPNTLLILVRAADTAIAIAQQRARQRNVMPAPLLIRGPTGAGKEVLARALHELSLRHLPDGPSKHRGFGPVNCGGLPTELIESELFGHAKDAFTGARSDRPGVISAHKDGTVFLDEIGDTPAAVQVRLLRFLNDGEVRKVGADKPDKALPWVICATHRDLNALEKENKFREDLLFRLQGHLLLLPALRERRGDILPVLAKCIARHANRPITLDMTVQARTALQMYPWPGNLRELDRLAYNLAISVSSGMSQALVEIGDLPQEIQEHYLKQRSPADQIVDLYTDRRPDDTNASIQIREALVEEYTQNLRGGQHPAVLPTLIMMRFIESSIFATIAGEETASSAKDLARYRHDETIRRMAEELERSLAKVDGLPWPNRQDLIHPPLNEASVPGWVKHLLRLGEEASMRLEFQMVIRNFIAWLDSLSPELRTAVESMVATGLRTVIEDLQAEQELAEANEGETATAAHPVDVPPDVERSEWKAPQHEWSEVRENSRLFQTYLERCGSAVAMAKAFGVTDRTIRNAAQKHDVRLQHGGDRRAAQSRSGASKRKTASGKRKSTGSKT